MRSLVAQMLQHHGTAPDLPNRVGKSLACDIRRRAMYRFKERREFSVRIQVGTGCNADGACTGWTEVTQNVTEQVRCDNHIEALRAKHKAGG